MKKRKFQKSENKSKRKKGTLVGNTILLVAIAVLVVSMLFTLCAKIVDKNDAKEELSSASDELLTLSPDEEESESLTDAPTEEARIPTTWKYLFDDSSDGKTPISSTVQNWQYAVGNTVVEIGRGDTTTGRDTVLGNFQRDVLTYGFLEGGCPEHIRVEAPQAFRVAYTCYSPDITYVYEVVDYPAGIHDLVYPANAGTALTVEITYSLD